MIQRFRAAFAFCLFGSLITAVGAVFRTSDVQAREELGVVIHRCGMGIMLVGFAGLLLQSKGSNSRFDSTFRWTECDGKVSVWPGVAKEILNLSAEPGAPISSIDFGDFKLRGVRCLIARGRELDIAAIDRLAAHQQIQIIDLQQGAIQHDALQALEKLESLELLLLAGCLEPAQTKELRMALPEVKMIFDPR